MGPLPPYPSWNDWRDEDCEVICEGELDAAVAIAHGILAVSGTAGAGTFLDDWASALTGQSRTLLYDAGRAGRDGAIKAAEKLVWAGCRVRIASWPDDAPDGYDVTDFFRSGGSPDEFRAILVAAKDYERQLDAKKYLRRRVVAA